MTGAEPRPSPAAWDALFVYGAGGHAKVVADAARCAGLPRLEGLVAEGTALGPPPSDLPVLGDSGWLREHARSRRCAVLLGIGQNAARERIWRECHEMDVRVVGVVHPSAVVSRSAHLGEGCVVLARAVINAEARLETGAIVNTGAIVEHDVRVGAFAHLSPGALTGGGARLGDRSQLGLGAVLLPRVSVGHDSVVGAQALVTASLPDGVIAYGVPARIRRQSPPRRPEAEA